MGRRGKGFFNKGNSVTYSLIHTSAPAGEQSQRLWVEKSRGVGVGNPDASFEAAQDTDQTGDSRWPSGHPLSFLEQEVARTDLTDAQRKEIVDLGLPDDGYDYLQHLRDPRAGPATAPELSASSLPEGLVSRPSARTAHLGEELYGLARPYAKRMAAL